MRKTIKMPRILKINWIKDLSISVVFNNGGFHQITLGYNFNCSREKFDCNCPSVN